MSSRFLRSIAFAAVCGLAWTTSTSAQSQHPATEQRQLRVCADPANMPFSDEAQQGFENKIAELLARDIHAHLTYVWQRMGRGFVREFVGKQCDVLIGVPAGYMPMLTTAPYYRSTYVFVTPARSGLRNISLDDPVLHKLKIGVQVVEDDYTPAGRALARRGMQANIVGYDTAADAPSIIRAVAERKVDAAIVWGPLAGYYARRYGGALQLTPVTPQVDPPGVPFTFAISMGVKKGNTQLREELEGFLRRRQPQVRAILARYGVPQLEMAPSRPQERGN